MSPFKTINRVALTFIPKENFVELLNKAFPNNTTTLSTVYAEGFQVYLVPNFTEEAKANAFLKKIAPKILEQEFESWKVPQEFWPESRTIETLLELFEYDASVGLFDTMPAAKKENQA